MENQSTCRRCQSALSETEALQGICPKCLMQLGLWASSLVVTGSGGPPPPLPEPERIAELLPQYTDLALIGHGGMGVVYRGMHNDLKRVVAIKVLPPSPDRDPAFAERFMREAQALAGLTHPGIVSIYDFGEREGMFFFAMEFIDGATLRQTMRSGLLEPAQALEIVSQICSALQYAHEHGVVHRDVKPENILIDRSGRVKITDFGLAKMLSNDSKAASLTQTFQVMGTPHYMAPEQFETPTKVDHRADIFSLGVVFYELLTGELPLGRFSPPSQVVRLDMRLDEVVMRTLDKFPEDRYQAAEEVRTDLDRITKAGLRKGKDNLRPNRAASHAGPKKGSRLRTLALVSASVIVLVTAAVLVRSAIMSQEAAREFELQATRMQQVNEAMVSDYQSQLQKLSEEAAPGAVLPGGDFEEPVIISTSFTPSAPRGGDGRDYFRFTRDGVKFQSSLFEKSKQEIAFKLNDDGSQTGFQALREGSVLQAFHTHVEPVLQAFHQEFMQISKGRETLATSDEGHLLVKYPAFVEQYGDFRKRYSRELTPALEELKLNPAMLVDAWTEGVAPYGWKPVEIEIWQDSEGVFRVIERFEGEEPVVFEPAVQLETHLARLWAQVFVVPPSALARVEQVLGLFGPHGESTEWAEIKTLDLQSAEFNRTKVALSAFIDAPTRQAAAKIYEKLIAGMSDLEAIDIDNSGSVSFGRRSPNEGYERMEIGTMWIHLGNARTQKLFNPSGQEDYSGEGAVTRVALNQGSGSGVQFSKISRFQSRTAPDYIVEGWNIAGESVPAVQLETVLAYLKSLEAESGQITVSALTLKRHTNSKNGVIEAFWNWDATIQVCSPN